MNFSHIQLPSNKKFGLFFSIIFLLIGAYFFFHNNITYFYFAIFLSFLFLILSILKPSLLHYLNFSWMFLGYILSKIFSPFLLGFIFFIIISPFAIIRRLLGNDELKIKKTKEKSYWIYRNEQNIKPNSFKNQF